MQTFVVALVLCVAGGALRAANRPGVKIMTFKGNFVDGKFDAVDYAIGIPGVKKAQIIVETVKKDGKDLPKTEGKIFDQVVVREETFGKANGVTLFFRSSKGAVIPKAGGSDTFQIVIDNAPEKLAMPMGTSTFRKKGTPMNRPEGDPVELVGFKIVNDPEYSILNDFLEEDRFSFVIKDLQFLIDVPPVTDTTVFLDFSNSYGFGPSQPDVDVDALDEQSMIFNLPDVPEGNWVFARGRLFVDGLEVGQFVHGESPGRFIPEPTTLALLAIGVCATSTLRLRFARTRKK